MITASARPETTSHSVKYARGHHRTSDSSRSESQWSNKVCQRSWEWVLSDQVDPRQLFFRVDIFRRRKIFRMVQTAGGNVDLIRPTVGLVGQ